MSRASTEASTEGSSPQQNALCKSLRNSCDCHTINTYEGKVNCGLARARANPAQ
jgi:hypothetical protein